ncbi:alpha/beta fold hydrolase [Streptomyces sp. NPDC047515]|uniref:alpha/beta fold hydrolase n=1 Tax=Streptomyces sp. NPDC047515 TaxID=3155380 RepID=UPI00340D17B6
MITPPGRGTRVDEEPVTDMAAYADAVAAEVRASRGGRRLVLIGVSLGALPAYETCCRLLDAGVPVARLCAVAGQCPGDFHGDGGDVTVEDARAFVTGVGLTDPELLADPDSPHSPATTRASCRARRRRNSGRRSCRGPTTPAVSSPNCVH